MKKQQDQKKTAKPTLRPLDQTELAKVQGGGRSGGGITAQDDWETPIA